MITSCLSHLPLRSSNYSGIPLYQALIMHKIQTFSKARVLFRAAKVFSRISAFSSIAPKIEFTVAVELATEEL